MHALPRLQPPPPGAPGCVTMVVQGRAGCGAAASERGAVTLLELLSCSFHLAGPCDALTRCVAGRAAQSYRPLSKDAIQQHLEDFGMEAEITNHNAILGLSGARLAPAAVHARPRSCGACAPGQGRAACVMRGA